MHPLTPSNTRLAGLYCAKVDFISRHFCGDKQVVENRGVSSPTRHRCTMRVSLLTASYKCSKSRWRWGDTEVCTFAAGGVSSLSLGSASLADRDRCVYQGARGVGACRGRAGEASLVALVWARAWPALLLVGRRSSLPGKPQPGFQGPLTEAGGPPPQDPLSSLRTAD